MYVVEVVVVVVATIRLGIKNLLSSKEKEILTQTNLVVRN